MLKLNAAQSPMWRDDQAPAGVKLDRVYIGADPDGLGGFQIAVAQSDTQPKRETLTGLFTRRRGRKQISLVVAVTHNGVAYLCGPDPQSATLTLPISQAERYLQSVLDEPDDLAARQKFASYQKALDTTNISGFTNSGLFASHHIRENVPKRNDWSTLSAQAAPLLSQRGQRLVDALGFRSKTGVGNTLILSADNDAPRAIAVLLDETEQFDAKSPRFQLTPVAFGLNIAARHEVPWLLVLRKDQIRLYPGKDGVGVGQKGQTETFFEVDLSTIDDEYAALLPLVFSASALQKNGTASELLEESNRYATALGTRLRERIYDDVVPPLAQHVASQLPQLGVSVDADGLATAYRLTLRILFRLLFQAYAEDRQLLPSGRNERYDANSLKTIAQRDMDTDASSFSEDAASIWFDLVQVWNAIDQGNPLWNVPAYNGGLFASDPERDREGALITKLRIPDSVLGPALQSLLVDISEDEVPGPVDFRSLSVREFGTIYEGLLESSLSLADADLAINEDNVWVPAMEGDEVIAPAGSVYFHSASGDRKATGSYFTPKIIVDHLLDRSVKPALSRHLAKISKYLSEGDEVSASREFFDFRVADLAMGSGHFLVAAVGKIEGMMRSFLSEHEVPGVRDELIRLAGVAKSALGDDQVAIAEVDEVSLLRRQIARRCIYGLDINQLAVELARLAIWIDTFVPGLPMSNLDHGLVCGNTLTGVGTVEEAVSALIPQNRTTKKAKTDQNIGHGLDLEIDETDAPLESGYQRMVRKAIVDHLATTLPLLEDVASASESTKAELQQSAMLLDEVRQAAAPARRLFDAAIATRMGRWQPKITRPEHVARLSETTEPSQIVSPINPAHMPVLFPEVFIRENPGFDVLIGNPPWEELKVEERSFWLQYRPGLYGLSDAERVSEIDRLRTQRSDLIPLFESQKREVEDYLVALRTGPFPGIGTGDPELAKAFAWRNWALTRKGGFLGIVLPRTLLNTAGGELWRKEVLRESTTDAHVLINTKRWAFDIHPQYAIALIAIEKNQGGGVVKFAGPFHSEKEFIESNQQSTLSYEAIAKATNEAAIPNISDRRTGEVFEQIRKAPRLDKVRPDWDYRPVREFDVTNDRKFYDAGGYREGRIPVWGGEGFNIWTAETGEVKAWADEEVAVAELQRKRKRQIRDSRSAFFGQSLTWAEDDSTLPFRQPRIVFRGISQRTNERTVISALIPGQVFLQNSSPYFFRRSGSERTDAWLLAFLCSIPLDWYARTLMETNLNFFILNGFPIVPLIDGDPLHERMVEISGRLAASDERFEAWATKVGVPIASVRDLQVKKDLKAELDALVSLLYGLSEDQVEHVFATFHRGWNYEPRLNAVLDHYRAWKAKQ